MPSSGKRDSAIRRLLDALRRRFRKKSPPAPEDPFAYQMAPLRRGPSGRSGAAVAEIEEDSYNSFPPRHTP